MYEEFLHYHHASNSDIERALKTATIVLDTNVLLDFYSYGSKTKSDYYMVLDSYSAKEQLWLPHQVGLEFFENRIGIIAKEVNQYDNVLSYIDDTEKKIANLSNSSPNHSHLDFKKLARDYARGSHPTKTKVERLKAKHPDYLEDDEVLKKFEQLYTSKNTGSEYTKEQIEKIVKEGEERYQNKIPPGYKDKDKKESDTEPSRNRKYGDLILWKQIIDSARTRKKAVILVTNDSKEDWVQIAKGGRKLGPKPSLKKELFDEAGVDFILLTSDEFLEKSRSLLKLTLDEDSLDEVRKYRELAIEREEDSKALESASRLHRPSYFYHHDRSEDIHYVVDKIRIRVKSMLDYASHTPIPLRMTHTINEIDILVKKIHHNALHGSPIFEAELEELMYLVKRVRNINPESDFFFAEKCNEILREIERLLVLITRNR